MTSIPSISRAAAQYIKEFEEDPRVSSQLNFAKSTRKGITWGVRLGAPLYEIPMTAYQTAEKVIRLFKKADPSKCQALLITPESLESFAPPLDAEKVRQIKDNFSAIFRFQDKLPEKKLIAIFYDHDAKIEASISLQGHVTFNKLLAEMSIQEAEFTFAHELSHFNQRDILKKSALKSLSLALPLIALFGYSFSAYCLSSIMFFEANLMFSRYCEKRADQDAIKLLGSNQGAIEKFRKALNHEALEVFLKIDRSFFSKYKELSLPEKNEVLNYLSKNSFFTPSLTHPESWERLASIVDPKN